MEPKDSVRSLPAGKGRSASLAVTASLLFEADSPSERASSCVIATPCVGSSPSSTQPARKRAELLLVKSGGTAIRVATRPTQKKTSVSANRLRLKKGRSVGHVVLKQFLTCMLAFQSHLAKGQALPKFKLSSAFVALFALNNDTLSYNLIE